MTSKSLLTYILAALPQSGGMNAGAIKAQIRQRIMVSDAEFTAAIALGAASGNLVRQFGGSVISRADKGSNP